VNLRGMILTVVLMRESVSVHTEFAVLWFETVDRLV